MIVRILGWLIDLGELLIVLNLPVAIIAILVHRARGFGGRTLRLSGHFWSLTLILWCAVEVFHRWGWPWILIGLFAGGIGIVPVAFFGFLFSRAWAASGELYLGCMIVIFAYGLSRWMIQSSLR
jgi:hypothetical protein